MLSFSDFIAQGCEDADMCEVIDTCAETELITLVLQCIAHPCAITPIRAVLNKAKTAVWGALNAHPCAKTPMCSMLIKPHRTTNTLFGLLQLDRTTNTHNCPHTHSAEIKKHGEIRGVASQIPRYRCGHTLATHWLRCQRMQARGLPPPPPRPHRRRCLIVDLLVAN